MAENKASAFGTISWYLIARDGHLSARVHPGMCLGEDDAGELSLKRDHGLLQLDIDDGRLRVDLLSQRHELLVPGEGGRPTLTVSPQTQVSIRLPNNLLSVDTNFATDNPFSETLELEVVEIPVVGSVDASARAARGPAPAEAHEPSSADPEDPPLTFEVLEDELEGDEAREGDEQLEDAEQVGGDEEGVEDQQGDVDEAPDVDDAETALPASVARLQEEHERAALDKRPHAPAPLVRLRRELAEPRRASLLFLAAVAVGFLLLFLQSRPEPRLASEPAPAEVVATGTSGDLAEEADAATGPASDASEMTPAVTAPEREDAPALAAEMPAEALEPSAEAAAPAALPDEVSTAAAELPDLTAAPATEAAILEPADADAAPAEPAEAAAVAPVSPESAVLLDNVTALLAGDALPPKATLDFAVQTLRALRVAYPQDPAVRESLEALTLRLTEEARQSFDRGELLRAGRLIEQASSTGVAQEAVASTVAYLEAPAPAVTEAALSADEPALAEAPEAEAPLAAAELPDAEVAAARDALEVLAEPEAAEPEAAEQATVVPEALVPEVTEPEVAGLDPSVAEEQTSVAASGAALDVMPPDQLDLYAGDDLAAGLPAGSGSGVDPLAPGPEYTGADDAATDAFVSTVSGADPELTAALDEALGIVGSLPAPDAAAAAELDEIYPFAQLKAVRVNPPRYPRRALDGVDGSVDLELTVTPEGRVEEIEVLSSGPGYFERAALRAVRGWRFEPVLRAGEAVPVRTRVRLTFDG